MMREEDMPLQGIGQWAVLPTGRTKSLAWPGLGTRPGAPSSLVGLVECALMLNVV
jgi:hypothetical protein